MSKSITVILYKSEVAYDVQNKSYLTARSRQDGANVEFVANMQANDNPPEMNQIMRSIGGAFDKLLTKLSPYIAEIVNEKKAGCGQTRAATDLPTDNTLMPVAGNELRIELTMPDNFNQSFLGAAKTGMHEYLVNSVLSEWFTLTNPQEATLYFAQAESNFQQIKMSLDSRIKPLKRKLSTF